MSTDLSLKLFNEFLYENEKKYKDIVYLRQPIHDKWHEITWGEIMYRARKITNFLKAHGLKKGDKIAILSKNCAEWFIADFAIAMGGFISVPLFATQHKDTIRYVLEHAEIKIIFVGKLDNWKDMESEIPENIIRVAFPYDNAMPAHYQWNDILEHYQPNTENYVPAPDDNYTIIYTSGTTGNPKGVMISFKAQAHLKKIGGEGGIYDRVNPNIYFSYLPLAHIFERMALEYCSILSKSTVSFSESLETFPRNLQDTAPTVFFGVPRIWTHFQQGVLGKISQHKLDILLKIPVLNSVLKKMIRKKLGLDRAKIIFSGAAPVSASLLNWYKKLGIYIGEGYGMTETLALTSFAHAVDHKVGTVGKPCPDVEVRINIDGEILIRSKTMMTGYFKDPEGTEKAFTGDAFFHTGDMGTFDEDGNLIILGRVSDPFKTDKGEFVNPVPIEGKFAKNPYIEQICCIGLNFPQPVLLVVLSTAARKKKRKDIEKSLKATLDNVNSGLTKFEKLSHVIVVKESWTPENALLTSTLKLKRHFIYAKYHAFVQKLFQQPDLIIWE